MVLGLNSTNSNFKKYIGAILVILLLAGFSNHLIADDSGFFEEEDFVKASKLVPFEEALAERNAAIQEALEYSTLTEYEKAMMVLYKEDVIKDYYYRYGMLVKGSLDVDDAPVIAVSSVASAQSIDDDGDYRILGKNAVGEWIENPFYDPTPYSNIDQREWINNDDIATIGRSVIGSMVSEESLFTTSDIIRDNYLHFIIGFKLDYQQYISQDFFDEYDEALSHFTARYHSGEFSMTNFEVGYNSFWDVGSGHGSRTGTDMGDFIRIVSIPTEHTHGLAYLFHERNGIIYYLSVALASEDFAKGELVGDNSVAVDGEIEAPSRVAETTTTMTGSLKFNAKSIKPLSSYEITEVSPGTSIDGPSSGMISSGSTKFNTSMPITIRIPDSNRDVSITVKVTDEDGITGEAVVTYHIDKLTPNLSSDSGDFTSNASGIIAADNRGIERYDIAQGIPTTESLYTNVRAKEYLHEEVFEEVSGKITYNVTVSRSYNLKWETFDGITWVEDSVRRTRTNTYQIERPYSYNLLNRLDVYTLKNATVSNGALPSESTTIEATGLNKPVIDVIIHSDHISESASSRNISVNLSSVSRDGGRSGRPSLPDPNWFLQADNAVGTVQVRNDRLHFDGVVVMNDEWFTSNALDPIEVPDAKVSGNNSLYKTNLFIPEQIPNKTYTSIGTVTYERLHNTNSVYNNEIHQDISGINSVSVHSPVVCYPEIVEDLTINQVMDKNDTKVNLIIDQTFVVDNPTSGQHKTIKGYGNRDYSPYVKNRQIKFDFDVYMMNKGRKDAFVTSGEWYQLPASEQFEFMIPHWVKENDYSVYFRTFANNTPSDYKNLYGFGFNENQDNYYAVAQIEVQVVGQLYDLRVIGTTESNYQSVFYDEDGTHKGTYFSVGDKDKSGEQNSSSNTLPIMKSKNKELGMENHVLKRGSAFFFSTKTNGNMKGINDFVVVKPSFAYMTYEGNEFQPVDLWYDDYGYKKLGATNYEIWTSLNSHWTGLEEQALKETSKVNYTEVYTGDKSLQDYENWYLYDDSKTSKKIGDSSLIALDHEQRLYVGQNESLPRGVTTEEATIGVQEFIGAYYLPPSVIALTEGTTDISQPLKDGYIIVNFDLYTIDGFHGDVTDYHLSYDAGATNMFDIEGFNLTQQGYTLHYGDVVFYDTNKSTDEDYTLKGIY